MQRGLGVGEARRGQAEQGRGWAEFEECVCARVVEGCECVGEANRVADVADPIVDRCHRSGVDAAIKGADQRDRGRGEADCFDDPPEVGEHRVHRRRVEGVRDPQSFGADAEGGKVLCNLLGGVGCSRDDDLGRSVDRSDGQLIPVVLKRGEHLLLRCGDGDHRSTGRQRLHQPAAGGDHPCRVVEGEESRGAGGRDFADAVPCHQVRGDAPGLP